jgi:hypothetical protein
LLKALGLDSGQHFALGKRAPKTHATVFQQVAQKLETRELTGLTMRVRRRRQEGIGHLSKLSLHVFLSATTRLIADLFFAFLLLLAGKLIQLTIQK